MSDTGYKAILDEALANFTAKLRQESELEVEIAKLKQFIHAAVNMLPDDERAFYIAKIHELDYDEEKRTVGLKEAIIRIVSSHPTKALTATQVRDRLLESNFDFTNYMANPLASVSTTLKRMVNREVQAMSVEDVAAYRWIPRRKDKIKRLRKAFGKDVG
jgi:hypothetical protein